MILWNGSTGSLGGYMQEAVARWGTRPGRALASRLEDRDGLGRELDALAATPDLPAGSPVCLVQMAAMVSVPGCEREPERAHRTNVVDTAATVRAFVVWAQGRGLRPGVVYVSTGHVYAVQPPGTRLREDSPVAPRSAYARSKAQGEEALVALGRELGAPVAVARVFGLIAPRQPPHYVLPGLIARARRRDLGAVPGASCVRDYLDSRDVCRSLVRLAEGARVPEVANVCSGEGVSIRAMLDEILRLAYPGQAAELCARVGEAPGRPDDIPWIVGDPTTLTQVTGDDARRIDLAQTIADALQIP
jgi:GDP-4-dehydro-6-deoxy-D-mannose reductase